MEHFSLVSKSISDLKLHILKFKTEECPRINENHNKKACYYYHQEFDRRRNVLQHKYANALCKNSSNSCVLKDKCKLCHNKVELLYHPKNYKTKYCFDYFTNNKICDFGDYCSFAHSKSELTVKRLEDYVFDYNFFLFKYKSEYCPFSNFNHDKRLCVYAHTIQDFRRVNMNLRSKTCQDWKNNVHLTYEENCPMGYKCRFCHGFKEYDYHPIVFKTKPCYLGKKNCKFGAICHFYHSDTERRIINTNSVFIMHPKNPLSDKISFDYFNKKSKILSMLYKHNKLNSIAIGSDSINDAEINKLIKQLSTIDKFSDRNIR